MPRPPQISCCVPTRGPSLKKIAAFVSRIMLITVISLKQACADLTDADLVTLEIPVLGHRKVMLIVLLD